MNISLLIGAFTVMNKNNSFTIFVDDSAQVLN